ncbi:MAG: CBS domain-containing protein [Candidatus Omnitrophota bacterium]
MAKVIAIMHKENVHTIPVYDKTKLVGVIGRHDVLNAALG